MTRTTKMILLLALLAFVLVAGLLAAKFIKADPVRETASDTAIAPFDPQKAAELSWTGPKGSYTLRKEGGSFLLAEDPAFPVNGDRVLRMLTTLSSLRSAVSVEGAQGRLSEYGLDPAALTVSVTLEDGSAVTVLSGARNDLISATYVMVRGSDTVYACPVSLEGEFTDRYGFMVWDELAAGSDRWFVSVDALGGRHFSATRVERPEEIYYSDGYKWFETGSIGTQDPRPLSLTETAGLCRALASVRLAACVSYSSTPEQLAEYGLDDPVVFRMKTRDEKKDDDGKAVTVDCPDYELRVGGLFTGEADGAAGEYRYAMVGSGSAVYAVDASKLAGLMDFDAASLLPTQLLKLTLDETAGFTLEYNGGVTDFAVEAEQVVTDYADPDDGTVRSDTSVRLNVTRDGTQRLVSTLFESSFNRLANMPVSGRLPENDAQDRPVVFRLTISTPAAAIAEVPLTFYEYSGTQYLVQCLGDRTALVSASEADDVLRSFRNAAVQ